MKKRYTDFDFRVFVEVLKIKSGKVKTYQEIARALGKPGAARAVGNALAANPLPIVVPCHRVVKKDGHIGRYSGGGGKVKRSLLKKEGIRINKNGKVF